jgi:hypothetical protein
VKVVVERIRVFPQSPLIIAPASLQILALVEPARASPQPEMINRCWTITTFAEPPPLIPTQHHVLDQFNNRATPIRDYGLRSQWTADKIIQTQEQFANGRLASAANSQFRQISE